MMGLLSFFFAVSGGSGKGNRYRTARQDETSLGNILLEMKFVTEEELEEAIKIQKSQSMLGSILVRMGVITEDQLEEALLVQRVRRKKAKNKEVIQANSKKHNRLVGEVSEGFSSLGHKYKLAGEK